MFENFSDKSIRVLMVGQREAAKCGGNTLGTEEILLGLAQERSGLVGHLLESTGFSLQRCRFELRKSKPQAQSSESGTAVAACRRALSRLRPMPLSKNALRLVEHANQEAVRSRSAIVTPLHLLLALAKLHDSVGYQLLLRGGVPVHSLQEKVAVMLGAPAQPRTTYGDFISDRN
jgi:ATP-dependent Clp protease ATP-binding subunit ClpA